MPDGIDYAQIKRAMSILEAEKDRAQTVDAKVRIGQALRSLERLDEPLKTLPIPDALLTEMCRTGRNGWIAELFDCGVELIRSHRARLGVNPFPRGGHPTVMRGAWMQEWIPKLKAMGYLENWAVVKVREPA